MYFVIKLYGIGQLLFLFITTGVLCVVPIRFPFFKEFNPSY